MPTTQQIALGLDLEKENEYLRILKHASYLQIFTNCWGLESRILHLCLSRTFEVNFQWTGYWRFHQISVSVYCCFMSPFHESCWLGFSPSQQGLSCDTIYGIFRRNIFINVANISVATWVISETQCMCSIKPSIPGTGGCSLS